MSPETHMRIGIVYACAGFLSLVLINGIITFMLTPGQGLATGNVWLGFFNPTYWPSVVVRLGICLILAGMFALFTAPRIASAEARHVAVRVSGLWIILPFFLLLGGSVWYFMASVFPLFSLEPLAEQPRPMRSPFQSANSTRNSIFTYQNWAKSICQMFVPRLWILVRAMERVMLTICA